MKYKILRRTAHRVQLDVHSRVTLRKTLADIIGDTYVACCLLARHIVTRTGWYLKGTASHSCSDWRLPGHTMKYIHEQRHEKHFARAVKKNGPYVPKNQRWVGR